VSHRRRIAALLLLAAVVLGTSGYDVVESERSVDVETASDADAYLGVQTPGGTADVGNETTPLTLANNYAADVEVQVTLGTHAGDLSLDGDDQTTVSVATDSTAGVTVTCDAAFDEAVAFDLRATAPNATVETTATADITCG